MPATGVRAPERMLVAVRAMAPVAGIPPKSGETMLAIPCATSSTLGLWRSPRHAIGDDGGEHAFECGEQRHGECGGNQRKDVLGMKVGNGERRKSAGNSAKRVPMVSTGR